ncbi:MAG: beta-lactamase family protein, partial [Oscillospiraceae bacterium]|jgi:CubicO group peptidase (beta-lactamase class C family)|nr:beta-lactamase family protein [Oscillospiraceae bacterium]
VGIAIAEGYINSIEDKVVDYFPDLDILIDKERKEQITIAQLLTMTSGFTGIIDPDELTDLFARSDLEERADEIIARFEADTTKFYFECASLVGDPGAYWNYSPISTDILAGLVAHAVGKPLLEYAEEKLFAPMGITNYSWLTDVDGTVHGAGGLFMTPRDMAKFGYLYLNYGRWEEQQLVPADWVAQSGPDSKLPFAYGHLFWNTPLVPFVGAYEAYGITGQLIDIFPGQDLVIVRTGSGTALENWIVGGILGG